MTNSRVTLSVLDQSPVAQGMTGGQALKNSIDLAQLADGLGYHRYWMAEHHATPMLACAAPEVMIGQIAMATSRMKIGSGGIMLPHYSPFKVAETFSMLAGLYPGRIDLGVGRAPGSDPRTALALQRDRRRGMADDFTDQLGELIAYLHDALPNEHPFERLPRLMPGVPETPDLWLLGSSEQSGIWAAELGLPYMFADFINPLGAEIAQAYRRNFAGRDAKPRSAVAVSVICAPTDEEAWHLSASWRLAIHRLHEGRALPIVEVDRAEQILAERYGSVDAIPRGRRLIFGSPKTVADGIEAVARDYQADEVMVVTIVHDHQIRRRSYELIAEAFGLLRSEAA